MKSLSLEIPANGEPLAICTLFSGYRPPDFARAGMTMLTDFNDCDTVSGRKHEGCPSCFITVRGELLQTVRGEPVEP